MKKEGTPLFRFCIQDNLTFIGEKAKKNPRLRRKLHPPHRVFRAHHLTGLVVPEDSDFVTYRNGKAFANQDIPMGTRIIRELPIAFTTVSDISPTFLPDLKDREALMLLFQIISGDQAFTRNLLKRFAPYQKELLGKGDFTKGWERVIMKAYVEPLFSDNQYLKNRMGKDAIVWWRQGNRLDTLRKVIMAMAYSPSDPLSGKHIDGLGVWFRASHFRHCCSDQATVYPLHELLRTDGGPVHFISLWTIRDVQAGEELTWSRIQAPFGVIADPILRPMLVTQSGKLCRCGICLHLEKVLQAGVYRAARKNNPKLKAAKTKPRKGKKKKTKKRGKRSKRKQKRQINELVEFIEGKRDSNPTKRETNPNTEIDPALVIDAKGEMRLIDESFKYEHYVVPLDVAIGTVSSMEKTFQLLTTHPFGLVAVVYSTFISLTVHLAHASEIENWERVLDICALMKRCLEMSPQVLDLVMTRNLEAAHQACMHYQRAFKKLPLQFDEDVWWWGAFYYRLMFGYGKDFALLIGAMHNAIMSEFAMLLQDTKDEGASKRIGCYYLILQQHLSAVFGPMVSIHVLEQSFSLTRCANGILVDLNRFILQKVVDYGGKRISLEKLRDFCVCEMSRDLPDPIYPHRVIRAIEKCDQVIASARIQKAAHRFLSIRHAIIGIQAIARGNFARNEFHRLRIQWSFQRRVAAIRIQRAIRHHMPTYRQCKSAAITIQAATRMWRASTSFNHLIAAAKTIQDAMRKKRSELQLRQLILRRRRSAAATLIQSHIRSMQAIRHLQTMKHAVTIIQSHFRSHPVRKAFLAKRMASIRIQAVQRMRVTRKRIQRKIAMSKFLMNQPQPRPPVPLPPLPPRQIAPMQLQFPVMPPLIALNDPLYLMHVAGCIRLNNDAKAAGYPEPFPNPWAMPTPYKTSPYYYPCPPGLKQ